MGILLKNYDNFFKWNEFIINFLNDDTKFTMQIQWKNVKSKNMS